MASRSEKPQDWDFHPVGRAKLLLLGAGGPARDGRPEVCEFHGPDGQTGGVSLGVILKETDTRDIDSKQEAGGQ